MKQIWSGRNLAFLLIAILFLTCSKSKEDKDTTPSFLLTAWIIPVSNFNAVTYDFTQASAAGKRTVEIRTWQKIGTLGWQSNQQYTALYEATDKEVRISSPTGFQETWRIVQVENTRMLIEINGQQGYVYNCLEPGWPDVIRLSTKACR